MEIMVAAAILTIVAGMIWTSFDQGARSIREVESSQDRYHEAQVALSVISRDLAAAYLTKHVNPTQPVAVVVFAAEDRRPIDRLNFVSFAHQRTIRDSHESDQCEIGYYGAPDPEDSSVTNLIRRVSPYIDDEPERGGQRLILAHDVIEFDLTYYEREGDQWIDEWDTTEATTGQPDRLPDQVRVLLTLREAEDQELTLTTQVPIHLHQALLFGRSQI
jgi:general secretion pathway protein J